ncbi:unnamed protein product [Gordionus sp. m RMFG-2023]|uniref:CD109 antigen-like isoform X2 n=1 Tax=Gordionus sp. m RMFG-2023 TaxID=3053472 RepID=UPI0030E3FCA6
MRHNTFPCTKGNLSLGSVFSSNRKHSLLLFIVLIMSSMPQNTSVENTKILSKNTYVITGSNTIRPDSDYDVSVQILRSPAINLEVLVVILPTKDSDGGIVPFESDIVDSQYIEGVNYTVIARAGGLFGPGRAQILKLKIPAFLSLESSKKIALKVLTNAQSAQDGDAQIGKEIVTTSIPFRRGPIITPLTNIRNQTELTFNGKMQSIFVQTDKSKYKPSDKVRFRVIEVDSTLKPLIGKVTVFITDSKENRIKQWLNQDLKQGTFSSDLQLADKAVLGQWTLTVLPLSQNSSDVSPVGESITKTFVVEEYVLPTFGVELWAPSFVVFDKANKKLTVEGYFEAQYTFGGTVPGKAIIILKDSYGDYVPRLGIVKYEQTELSLPVTERSPTRITFKISIDYTGKENYNADSYTYGHTFSLSLTFTDSLTLKSRSANRNFPAYISPYQLTLVGPTYFKPGLEYELKIIASKFDGKPLTETDIAQIKLDLKNSGSSEGENIIQFKRTMYYSKPYQIDNETFTSEITKQKSLQLDSTGMASVVLNDLNLDINRINFEGNFIGQTRKFSISTNKFEEPSNLFLELRNPQQAENDADRNILILGSTHTLIAVSSSSLTNLTVLFIARGRLVSLKTVLIEPSSSSSAIEIKFPVMPSLVPSFKVLAYLVSQNGNVIADSLAFKVDKYSENFVELNFEPSSSSTNNSLSSNSDSLRPGAETSLKIKTVPNSFVTLLAVDKSVSLLDNSNDITEDVIRNELALWDSGPEYDRPIYGRFGYPRPSSGNVYQTFKSAGLAVLTDAELYVGSDIVYSRNFAPMSFMRGFAGPSAVLESATFDASPAQFMLEKNVPIEASITTRKDFPETWIWEELIADGQGFGQLKQKVPDTITTWVATAISINDEKGLAITKKPSELRVFQPFFVSLNLPYSIVRGEKVKIQALIYNYMGKDIMATIKMEGPSSNQTDPDFEILDPSQFDDKVSNQLVPSGSVNQIMTKINDNTIFPAVFYIRANKVGLLSLSVKAFTDMAGDAIEKLLPVKAEGETLFFNKPYLINLNRSSDGKIGTFNEKFVIPWDIGNMVEGSNHLEVSVIGDIMGPSLNNIGNLVRLPYGCGEQNMLNFAPNLYIYFYLQTKGLLTPEFKSKIVSFTEQGFQRQLTYQRYDGSFSAFGNSDKQGSVWLTAFVLKSFAKAKSLGVIYIQDKIILDCLTFLLNSQILSNVSLGKGLIIDKSRLESIEIPRDIGSWREIGEVHHKAMQGGASKGLALTAYVYIALKETSLLFSDPSINVSSMNPVDSKQRALSRLSRSLILAEKYLANRVKNVDSSNLNISNLPYDLSIAAYSLTLATFQPRKSSITKRWAEFFSHKHNRNKYVVEPDTGLGIQNDRPVSEPEVTTTKASLLTDPTLSTNTIDNSESTEISTTTYITNLATDMISAFSEKMHSILDRSNSPVSSNRNINTDSNPNSNDVNTDSNKSTFTTSFNSSLDSLEPIDMEVHSALLNSAADQSFQELLNLAQNERDFTFWHQAITDKKDMYGSPQSLDFETTAYALLTLASRGKLNEGLSVLRWLVSNRNALGGYSSTQDTVIALNALSTFGALLPTKDQDIIVTVSGDTKSHEVRLTPQNTFVKHSLEFGSTLEKELTLIASGIGTALIQVSWSYNIVNKGKETGFELETKVVSKNNTLFVDICMKYAVKSENNDSRSNMIVLEINSPSGYLIDKESVLTTRGNLEAKISELSDANTKLNLYYDSLGSQTECLKLEMQKLFEISDIKPSLVKLSDYYQPEFKSVAYIEIPAL